MWRMEIGWIMRSAALVLCLESVGWAQSGGEQRTALTLVSRSVGLGVPDLEGGKTELELADFNGDGHLDIVSVGDHGSPFVNSGEHGIMVWLGDGNGSWSSRQSGSFGYGGCAAGDLNRDGLVDLAWGIHHDWGVTGFGGELMGAALGTGNGADWTPWGSGLASLGETWGMFSSALADFDEDGLLDVVSQSFGGSNGLSLYRNLGDGNWSAAWSAPGSSVGFTIEACDVNADGHMDLVTTRAGTNVYLGDGGFGFTPAMDGLPSGSIRGIHCGDLDNDGDQDLVFAYGSSGARCYRWDRATSSWTSASSGLPSSGSIDRAQLGDVNGDGWLDVVLFGRPTGRVYLGNGGTSWSADALWSMPAPGTVSALRLDGDTDHDGREDIVVSALKNGFPFQRNQLRVYSAWQAPESLAVRVAHPLGGEVFRAGSIRDIRWLSSVPAAQGQATVELQLSRSGPSGPWITLASGLPDNGRYEWKVPAGSTSSRIRAVLSTASTSTSAVSSQDFTILGGSPVLEASATSLPSTGGVIDFTLSAGPAFSGRSYMLVGGMSGTQPGTPLPGGLVTVPLNADGFTSLTLRLANTPSFVGFKGTLDASGAASASMTAPAIPGFIGAELSFAFATTGPFDSSSNAVSLRVVP